jgi:hypothetical protein
MASLQTLVETFCVEHELDPDMSDEIRVLVVKCFEYTYSHMFNVPIPETEDKKAKKVLKSEKIDNPSECTSLDELDKCTTGTLNQYCSDHELKKGGTKKELKNRVWRHMQGEASDEDKSSRSKAKKEKKVPEKHVCEGTNASGMPCNSSGTEDYEGCYFCWRHFSDAQKFIDAKNAPTKIAEPVKPKKAAPKAPVSEPISKPAKTPKGKKVTPPPPPPEPESELEEEEEVDVEDQQETDNEN